MRFGPTLRGCFGDRGTSCNTTTIDAKENMTTGASCYRERGEAEEVQTTLIFEFNDCCSVNAQYVQAALSPYLLQLCGAYAFLGVIGPPLPARGKHTYP